MALMHDVLTDAAELARQAAQADIVCRHAGGFVVARLTDGGYGYFPIGQPVSINGSVDHGATVVEAWSWTGDWWRVYPARAAAHG
jgi:hypothetical protein